jgi:hypothetical protein
VVLLLKHKLRPENAYFNAHNFDVILSAPKEELLQNFIGHYGDHLLPATKHEIEKVLQNTDTIKGFNKKKGFQPEYIISKKMQREVGNGCVASVDSSTSTMEITDDYSAHFYDMYINNHDGKHMTGDRMKVLLLNLPFLLRDLVAPEVRFDIFPDVIPDHVTISCLILVQMSYPILTRCCTRYHV